MPRVCVLTRKEVDNYTRHNAIPDCSEHDHITKRQAECMEAQAIFDFIGPFRGHRRKPRTWKRRNSGGVPVMQWVEIKGRRRA